MTHAYLYGLTHRVKVRKSEPPRYQPCTDCRYAPCEHGHPHTEWLHRDMAGCLAHLAQVFQVGVRGAA